MSRRLAGLASEPPCGGDPLPQPGGSRWARTIFHRAFTLVELLVVMAIILLIIGLGVPAFNSIKGSRDITTTAYDIAGTLEQARAYAMSNRTYVWVGFFEEDGTTISAKQNTSAGVGRVVLCVVASKDGSRYKDTTVSTSKPKYFGANDPSNLTPLIQLNKLVKLDDTHLVAANISNGSNTPDRPSVASDYQVGDLSDVASAGAGPFSKISYTSYASATPTQALTANPTTFSYPLGSPTPQYTFVKVIEFNPQGEASKIVDNISSGNPAWLEIAVIPARGNVADPRYVNLPKNDPSNKTLIYATVIQVGGLNGRVRIFRP